MLEKERLTKEVGIAIELLEEMKRDHEAGRALHDPFHSYGPVRLKLFSLTEEVMGGKLPPYPTQSYMEYHAAIVQEMLTQTVAILRAVIDK